MSLTNLSKVTTSGIATGTSLLITNVNSSGVVTASTVQVGSATTIHTTGIDLGSGNITSHNINSTGIITSTSFVGPVTGDLTGNVSSSGANTLGSLTVTNDATVGGALTVTGDLTVNGTTTTIDTAVTAVDSLAIDGNAIIDGSVGIGTDNPSSKVTVAADSATSQLELKRTNANTTGAIGALNFTALDGHSVANIYAVGDGDDEGAHLAFRTTSAAGESDPYGSNTFERLRIDSGGKIASTYDGTPTVAQYGQLEVTKNGASDVDPNWSYLSFHRAGHVAWQQGIKDNHFVIAHTAGAARDTLDNERLRITTSGNVGIGSTNPGTKLDILNGSDANVIATINGADTSSEYLGFGVNGTSALITAGGNGSTSTSLVFRTANSGTESERLYITSGGSILHLGNGTTSNPAITLSGTAPTNTFVTTSSGKVGIGTDDPKKSLSVFGSDPKILIRDGASTSAFADCRLEFGNFSHYPTAFISHKWDGTNGSMSFHTRVGGDEYTRMVLNSGGELLLGGLTSNTLASDDLQIQGSGGPAIISGYKADNNPTSDQKMLTLRGYSQSDSTFTSIGEIDVRVDQGSNTASGYHPGSIVTRVNGGSETGTHSTQAYSFAGVKDRERITHKSKRFYCLPEYTSSDLYNTFRQQWDYQHYVGYNQYSWYKYSTHASISSRGGSADIMVTWSTGHAAGSGFGRYAVVWRDRHDNHQLEITQFNQYFENSANGTYYGWTSNPSVDVYQCSGTYNSAGFYLRVQGHISANSGTYNGNAIQQFTINSHTNRYGADVEKFEFVGNSTPSDAGSQLTKYSLP